MDAQLKELTIDNFAKGAAKELFERELGIIMKNIEDPNTKSDVARTITLQFTIKPDTEKEQAQLMVESKSKLAPVRHAVGQTYFGRKNGRLTAFAHNINQMELELETKLQPVTTEGHA